MTKINIIKKVSSIQLTFLFRNYRMDKSKLKYETQEELLALFREKKFDLMKIFKRTKMNIDFLRAFVLTLGCLIIMYLIGSY